MKRQLWLVTLITALWPSLMLHAQQENREQRSSGRSDQGNQAERLQQGERNRQGEGGRQGERAVGGSGLGNYQKPPPANDIPAHPFDIILGRPTNQSIDVRVLQNDDGQGIVNYRVVGQKQWLHSAPATSVSGKPVNIKLDGLKQDTEYEYQWKFEGKDRSRSIISDTYNFRTQRSTGSNFSFSVSADSHLDENSSGAVYTQTLKNALAERPDFHLELGDTFMTGKYMKPELSYGQYLAQRYYLSNLCSSAPLFFVMGNHDGESAGRGSFTWASNTRKSLFPNPSPNGFYTGNTQEEAEIGFPEDYYAWLWGDAQFIVLDPYRYTIAVSRRRTRWWRSRWPTESEPPAADNVVVRTTNKRTPTSLAMRTPMQGVTPKETIPSSQKVLKQNRTGTGPWATNSTSGSKMNLLSLRSIASYSFTT
ncbi:MAG: hypothetical protein U0930_23840 [Pirellulales bacterium]